MNDISGGTGIGYFTSYSRSQKKYYKVFVGLERKTIEKGGSPMGNKKSLQN